MKSQLYHCEYCFNAKYGSQKVSQALYDTFQACVYLKMNSGVERESVSELLEIFFKRYHNHYFSIPDNSFPEFALEETAKICFGELKEFLRPYEVELVRLDMYTNPARVVTLRSKPIASQDRNTNKTGKLIPKFPNLHWEIYKEMRTPVSSAEKNKITAVKWALFIFILAVCSICVAVWMKWTGIHPMGSDVYGHLWKGDLLYQNWKQGEFYPLYTPFWYNGMQPFRYWAPFPYMLLAGLEFVSGGDPLTAYFLLSGLLCFIGGLGWVSFGIYQKRPGLGLFFGILWFFLPDNLRIFFSEGNVPRMVIGAILPYLSFCIWKVIKSQSRSALFPLALLTAFIVLCHAMIAAMTGIAVFIFVVLCCLFMRRYRESIYVLSSMLLGIASTGFWLVPALKGGLVGMDSEATQKVMESLSVEASRSLNPFLRLLGDHDTFYFGISLFVISVLGLLFAGREKVSGFAALLFIFLGTTTAALPLLRLLPYNQLFWMQRFLPIGTALFLISFLEWKSCKKGIVILFCIIMAADSIGSLWYLRIPDKEEKRELEQVNSSYLLEEAKEITNQRMAILDLSLFGSFPSYQLCQLDSPIQYSFGWAWQGASTASNLVRLNTAFEKGHYPYAFDRCIQLGNDTVLVKRSLVPLDNEKDLLTAAKQNGFYLVKENQNAFLFHKDTPKSFGVISRYSGLTIGTSACETAILFPGLKEGDSDCLTDYSFEELCDYDTIYLSGFTYKNKDKAEDLLKKVSQKGVRIVIDMQNIPKDSVTGQRELLGVTAHSVLLSESYPDLQYKGEILKSQTFDQENSQWNTVFLSGLEQTVGTSHYLGEDLSFAGTGEDENIVFLGFNLMYHILLTKDEDLIPMSEELMKLSVSDLPKRDLCELDISVSKNEITVSSDYDCVNTAIAYQDTFTSSREISYENNLLTVSKGITQLTVYYPVSTFAVAVTVIGIAGCIFLLCCRKRKKI